MVVNEDRTYSFSDPYGREVATLENYTVNSRLEMPATGGPGAAWYAFFGMMLVAAAVLFAKKIRT